MTQRSKHARQNRATAPATGPPRWKQTLLTFIAIYPMLVAIQELWGDDLASLPLPVRTLITVAVIATLANYLVLPVLIRLGRPLLRQPAHVRADFDESF